MEALDAPLSTLRASKSELLVDESFLLRVLRDVVARHILPGSADAAGHAGGTSANGSVDGEATEALEGRLETLWDLCVDRDTAAFLVGRRAVTVLAEAAARSQRRGSDADGADGSDAEADAAVRCAEVCLGALGNIATHGDVVAELDDEELRALESAALLGLASPQGVVVLQALRLARTLLGGPAGPGLSGLWGAEAIGRYLYALDNSMLWDAVQHACDALSQILAAEQPEGAAAAAAAQLAQEGLQALLAERLRELAAAMIGGSGDVAGEAAAEGDGDAEAALLSALCLADTFLTAMPPSNPVGFGSLGSAALRALAAAGRPEVIAAALELIASLLEVENDAAACPATCSGSNHDTPSLVPSEPGGLAETLRSFAADSAAAATVAEKVAMHLADGVEQGDGDDSAALAALVLMQHAPRDVLEEYRPVLSAVGGRLRCAGLLPNSAIGMEFLALLGPDGGEVAVGGAADDGQERSRSRSRSR